MGLTLLEQIMSVVSNDTLCCYLLLMQTGIYRNVPVTGNAKSSAAEEISDCNNLCHINFTNLENELDIINALRHFSHENLCTSLSNDRVKNPMTT